MCVCVCVCVTKLQLNNNMCDSLSLFLCVWCVCVT